MKEKILNTKGSSKKKVAMALMSAALLTVIGSRVAFASNSVEKGNSSIINNDEEPCLVKQEDGIMSYSMDDGKTWTEGIPEGASISEDGENSQIENNETYKASEGAKNSLAVKIENGVTLYSTDEGKTWSENAPDGTEVSEENGKLTVKQ